MRGWMTITGVLVVWLAACPQPGSAQTTSVRVTATEAEVRLSPDHQSPVVGTVKVGAVLTVTGTQGEWYEVRLPDAGGGPGGWGYVRAGLLEPFGSDSAGGQRRAFSRGELSKLIGVSLAQGAVLAPDWQARHDRAIERKRSGRVKMLAGLPIAWVGAALAIVSSLKANTGNEETTGGAVAMEGATYGLMGGGALLAVFGARQLVSANRELLLLDVERQEAQRGVTLQHPFGERGRLQTNVVLSLRAAPTAAVHVSW